MRAILGLALAVAMMVAGIGAGPARAQTVDEIISRGTINIGVLVDLPPYGLLNSEQQPDGYDIEVAKLLGKFLGVKVNLVPLTGPNRIPFLVSGKVDLIVATFGITPERAKTARSKTSSSPARTRTTRRSRTSRGRGSACRAAPCRTCC
jgi:polar amino acid transport system substrate-binding protein